MEAGITAEYDSSRSRATILGEFRDLLRYRDFLKLLVSRTIKSRYKRSALGVAWTLLNPLVNMVVLTIAFSTVFGAARPRYPVYLLTGLVAWNFFTQSTAYAAGQLFWGANLMKIVPVPPTIFAVACVANGLVNLAFSLVPLLGIMVILHHPFSASFLFLPVGVVILAGFALGVALLLSSLAVFFVDFMDMYQLLLQAWFFVTPIIYPESIIPARFSWALTLNPMYYMVEIVRRPLYVGELPDGPILLTASALSLAALLLGAWIFMRKADELAYRI